MVQNDDIKVRLTLTDGINPYTISALNALEVYVYVIDGANKKLVSTHKLNAGGLYNIAIDDDPSGKVTFVIQRQDTVEIKIGKLYAEVRLRLSASSEYISSVRNIGSTGIYITTIDQTANPNSLK